MAARMRRLAPKLLSRAAVLRYVRQLLTSFEENLGKWLPLSKAGPVRICRRSPGAGRSLAHVGGQPAGGVLWRGEAGSGLRSRGSWPILG